MFIENYCSIDDQDRFAICSNSKKKFYLAGMKLFHRLVTDYELGYLFYTRVFINAFFPLMNITGVNFVGWIDTEAVSRRSIIIKGTMLLELLSITALSSNVSISTIV